MKVLHIWHVGSWRLCITRRYLLPNLLLEMKQIFYTNPQENGLIIKDHFLRDWGLLRAWRHTGRNMVYIDQKDNEVLHSSGELDTFWQNKSSDWQTRVKSRPNSRKHNCLIVCHVHDTPQRPLLFKPFAASFLRKSSVTKQTLHTQLCVAPPGLQFGTYTRTAVHVHQCALSGNNSIKPQQSLLQTGLTNHNVYLSESAPVSRPPPPSPPWPVRYQV